MGSLFKGMAPRKTQIPICIIDGCFKPTHGKNMCKLHYQRSWRIGSPHVSRPCLHGSTEDRFWNHAVKGSSDTDCWRWNGYHDKDGYGRLRSGNTQRGAHIASWQIHFGDIPKGYFVLHSCNNPECSNPKHLKLGDQSDNMKDRIRAGNFLRGEYHFNAKISDADVAAILSCPGTYESIAKKFGLSESQVGNIKRRQQRITTKDGRPLEGAA